MDGTILDSMPLWENLGRDYLESLGIIADEQLVNTLAAMTLQEAVAYFHREIKLQKEPEVILEEVLQRIESEYDKNIPAKKGMCELVLREFESKSRICMLTSSDYRCAHKAMQRLGIRDCFEEIYTSNQLKMSKRKPDIYLEVCRRMEVRPEQVIVYEDVLHAIQAAKHAGCYVIAVYDAASANDWKKIKGIADEVIE